MKEHKSSFGNYDSSLKAECDKGNENLQNKTEKDTQDLKENFIWKNSACFPDLRSILKHKVSQIQTKWQKT